MATQRRQGEKTAIPAPASVESTPLYVSMSSEQPEPTSITALASEAGAPDRVLEFRWKYAEETHVYIREYIRHADQKAFFFSAAGTALLAFLYKANLVHHWVKAPVQWGLLDVLSFLATFGLAISALLLFVVVFPSLSGSRRGLVFFDAIAEYKSSREYTDDLCRHDLAELLTAKLAHIYELARLCSRKYAMLCWGLWIGLVGLASAVLLLIFAAT